MAGRMPFSSSMPDMFDPYAAIQPAYMRRPVERPTAYYFLRTVLIAGGIAGCLVALYRNDVLLELSRHVGQESRYFQLEQYLGVTPGWGTPRSMQPVLEGVPPAAEQPVGVVAALPVTAVAEERPVAAPTTDPAPADAQPESPTSNAPIAAALAPVSLESLPLLPRSGRAAVVEAAPVAAEPEHPAPVSRSAPASRPEPEPPRSRRSREAEADPAPVAKAPKAPSEPKGVKTTPNPHDNPLTASIRAAVRARPAKN